jgi:LacI family transcriptional regulator
MAKEKASMRDIARTAGVSVSAVWMAIHEKPGLSPETQQRILDAIASSGYSNKSTSSARSARALGLMIEQSSIPAMMDSFYGDVIRGFQAEAQAIGYHVNLMMFDRTADGLDAVVRRFEKKVAGLVVANDGDITAEMVIRLLSVRTPIVLIENHLDKQGIPCVVGDNVSAGYQVAQHLLALGHREIAVLPGPSKYSSLVDRLRGIRSALAEDGLLIRPEWMPQPVPGHPVKGYVQMKEILALDHHPTAVIAISDKTAFGAMEAIREVGLKIPDDIAIASIDNTLESAYARPPLTTVNIPKFEMGVLAFQKLHRLIQGQDTIPVKTIVYSELIVRESCGATLRRGNAG